MRDADTCVSACAHDNQAAPKPIGGVRQDRTASRTTESVPQTVNHREMKSCIWCHKSKPDGKGPGTWNGNYHKHLQTHRKGSSARAVGATGVGAFGRAEMPSLTAVKTPAMATMPALSPPRGVKTGVKSPSAEPLTSRNAQPALKSKPQILTPTADKRCSRCLPPRKQCKRCSFRHGQGQTGE